MSVKTLYKKRYELLDIEEFCTYNLFPHTEERDSKEVTFNLGTRGDIQLYKFRHKKNYLNMPAEEWKKKCFYQFTSAFVNRVTFVIEKLEDKIRFSIFYFTKERKAGKKYFWKTQETKHLTFNLKTKDIFVTTSTKRGRVRTVHTNKNPF